MKNLVKWRYVNHNLWKIGNKISLINKKKLNVKTSVAFEKLNVKIVSLFFSTIIFPLKFFFRSHIPKGVELL